MVPIFIYYYLRSLDLLDLKKKKKKKKINRNKMLQAIRMIARLITFKNGQISNLYFMLQLTSMLNNQYNQWCTNPSSLQILEFHWFVIKEQKDTCELKQIRNRWNCTEFLLYLNSNT